MLAKQLVSEIISQVMAWNYLNYRDNIPNLFITKIWLPIVFQDTQLRIRKEIQELLVSLIHYHYDTLGALYISFSTDALQSNLKEIYDVKLTFSTLWSIHLRTYVPPPHKSQFWKSIQRLTSCWSKKMCLKLLCLSFRRTVTYGNNQSISLRHQGKVLTWVKEE